VAITVDWVIITDRRIPVSLTLAEIELFRTFYLFVFTERKKKENTLEEMLKK